MFEKFLNALNHKQDSEYPEINMDEASEILANAFAANDMEENEIPLEVLASYSKYRRERFILQRVIIILLLFLFLLLPILFVRPAMDLVQTEDADTGRPAYQATVSVWLPLPVNRITATIDGVNMPVYEVDANVYSVQPTANGHMVVTATLVNEQRVRKEIDVTGYDPKSPVMKDNAVENGQLVFYLADDGSGVDFDGIYAETMSGKRLLPVEMDPETGRVAFDYPTESVNVVFPDKVGNRLQIIVTLRKTVTEREVPAGETPEEAPEADAGTE